MEVAYLVLAAAISVSFLALFYRAQTKQAEAMARLLDLISEQSRVAQEERAELLNRIQHPERPAKATGRSKTDSNVSPEARRQLRQVGTVAPQVTDAE